MHVTQQFCSYNIIEVMGVFLILYDHNAQSLGGASGPPDILQLKHS